jgi:hypothetical protein
MMRRKCIFIALFVLLPLSAWSQDEKNDEKKPVFTIGVFGGVDKNINGYRLSPNIYGNNFYADKPSWNAVIDYGLMVTKKLRPRIEFRYLQSSYFAGWENANISTMKETIVRLFTLGLGLHADYLLHDRNNFQIFASPGIIWEYTAGSDEKNIRDDNTCNWYDYNGISGEKPGNLFGGAVSAIFKYNITKSLGLKAVPEYDLYFGNFAKSNDKPYQSLRINFGVEFNFY